MRLSKKILLLIVLSSVIFSGCGSNYSNNTSRAAVDEYIMVVQRAVDLYIQKLGVPPIKNKAQETPLYEKYQVDFKKLLNYQLISTIPTNAFENGGTIIYVLIKVETKTQVKLMDLITYKKMVELQDKVDQFMKKNQGQIPKGIAVAAEFYVLDHEQLSEKSGQLRSPYSNQFLSIIIHISGQISIDYAPEIMKMMKKKGLTQVDAKTDLRALLVEEGIFVPVRSFPYYWINNEPSVRIK